jgi:hypothetical protein
MAVSLNEEKKISYPFCLQDHDGVVTRPAAEEEIAMSTTAFRGDLATSVLSVCEVDGMGLLHRQDLERDVIAAHRLCNGRRPRRSVRALNRLHLSAK